MVEGAALLTRYYASDQIEKVLTGKVEEKRKSVGGRIVLKGNLRSRIRCGQGCSISGLVHMVMNPYKMRGKFFD
jgi:hypothetical protein